jgi:long-chain acyl-CoA synthetase
MSFTTLWEVLEVHSADRPDRAAIITAQGSISWRQLRDRVETLAGRLSGLLEPGDRVARVDKNGIDYFELVFAAVRCGAVVVDVNWRLTSEEMVQIVDDAQARLVLVGDGYLAQAKHLEAIPSVQTVLCSSHGTPYEHLGAWLLPDSAAPAARPFGWTSDDVCLQLYTSGTTGLPKGVMLTHGNIAACIAQFGLTAGMGPGSVALIAMPLFHIGGAGWAFSVLASGATGVLQREFDPIDALGAIQAHRVTHAVFVPAMLRVMSDPALLPGVDVTSLELIFYGASPISETVLRGAMEAFGCQFAQLYGLTETTGPVLRLAPEHHDPDHNPGLLRSCGQPCPGVEVRVVDGDGIDLADGIVGEVLIRSPQVMLGYWNRPHETGAVLTDDGWFHTGDAGFLDEGYLYLQDRLKDIIVSGAENISPAEVENALMAHPGVGDVAVIAVPDPRWGEAVKAIVVPADSAAPPAAAELIEFGRERISAFKCPKSVDFVDELPRNASGKILKRELRERYWSDHERRIG